MGIDRSGKVVLGSVQSGVAAGQIGYTATDTFQNGAIPADTAEIIITGTQVFYVVCDTTAAAPSNSGAIYQASTAHRIPCYGCTYIHLNKIGSNVNISWTAITRA